MINPEDEINLDLSTSCTKEAAAAKLLGWMKGPIRPKVIKVTEHGISEDQLPFLQSMEGPLEVQLLELHEAARQDFVAAAEADATYEELNEKEEVVTQYKALMVKAHVYMLDIDEELSKGENSAIKIDHETTKRTGITHITLRSLDRWEKQKYDIPLLDDQVQHLSPDGTQAQPTTQEKEGGRDSKGGLSKIKTNNLLTTFAFLVEDFAKSAPKYNIKGEPNKSAIAEYIEKLATNADTGETLGGLSDEAIKSWIEAAMKAKKDKLNPK